MFDKSMYPENGTGSPTKEEVNPQHGSNTTLSASLTPKANPAVPE
jgi:hypothetical protein